MNHRLTPYDFKNPQDVLDALEKATSEYLDMMGIDRGLSDIGLLFEDSVRQHYPEKWLRLGLSGYDGSEPLSTAKILRPNRRGFSQFGGTGRDQMC